MPAKHSRWITYIKAVLRQELCSKTFLLRRNNRTTIFRLIFQTLHKTMCEETVFWDLNYAIKYKSLGTEDIRAKVLRLMETLEESILRILSGVRTHYFQNLLFLLKKHDFQPKNP